MKNELTIHGTPEEAKLTMKNLETRLIIRDYLIRINPDYFLLDNDEFTVDIKANDGDDWIRNWITVKKKTDKLSQLTLKVEDDDWPHVINAWKIINNDLRMRGLIDIADGNGVSPSPSRQDLLDKACVQWANRDFLAPFDMIEFLTYFGQEHSIYITKDQFKRSLRAAGRRGLIVKVNRRWRGK